MTTESCDKPAAMIFEVLKAAVTDGSAARLGRLALSGRRAIDTPNFFAHTSRGVVPHITPDNVKNHLSTGGAYMALEDFIEQPQQASKRQPAVFNTPTSDERSRALHNFTAMPSSVVTVLAARRLAAIPAPMGNSNSSVSVFTSNGFQNLPTKEYHAAIKTLRPDIAIPLADLSLGPITPTSKRALRMAERTDDWVNSFFADLSPSALAVSTFAPVPPIPYSIQWEYLERLSEDLLPTSHLSGLAIYDPSILPDLLPAYPNLTPLPRLSLSNPSTPHHLLQSISLGLDVFVLPFINAVSDSGIAMAFTFPPPAEEPPLREDGTRILPLGIDLSSDEYKSSVTPLSPNCKCYACTKHHAAFVNHLLAAREMLGWTLLQIHNHEVVSAFFAGVRATLAEGEEAFGEAVRRFARVYEPEFPAGTGQRPRARGYQFKSEARAKPLNKPSWGKWDDEEKIEQKVAEGSTQVGEKVQ